MRDVLRHLTLEAGIRLAARPPDHALVLDAFPLNVADPPGREVVDDDRVGPVDDVGVQVRLAPVDPRTGLAHRRARLLEALDEFGVVGGIRQGGPDALTTTGRHFVAAWGEDVIAEVGEHPQVVVLGDGMGGEEDDVHFRTARNGPPPMPSLQVTVCVLPRRLANDSGEPSR